MKALIFDSSAVISLALNDLLHILEPLKEAFDGNFYLSKTIKSEIVDYSIETRRFMLEAFMINSLIEKGVFTVYDDKVDFDKVLNIANSTFQIHNDFINMIHRGEASCVALYKQLDAEKKAIVIDERTTRMLCEAPEKLHRLMELKLGKKITVNKDNFKFFKDINIIRSSELALVALKKGIINFSFSREKVLEGLLYALKFKGCSISNNEIQETLH